MEELDLLKDNWNKNTEPKFTKEEIYKMILKKSSSSVKWIFIVSIIEMCFVYTKVKCNEGIINVEGI